MALKWLDLKVFLQSQWNVNKTLFSSEQWRIPQGNWVLYGHKRDLKQILHIWLDRLQMGRLEGTRDTELQRTVGSTHIPPSPVGRF